ncbi:hypothetical protein ASPVEDRAFT_515196 [Aspergillus versicolor CBS 583.65]|uniref:Transmembrane protein n=1 Tax=Aspergillus versicolor CBS 583.65 TaxID=1036611 RepID=A0A1L9PD82_ASPVE|nr:uncharacterized protein ASPVEDRAFT_515196 [Aspergillus versicolor CBS 583.65]OJI99443.1 hypothetical protein ASPVEDRAFT_515196 [Aspergillus versicolor CBS 583.65]
MNKLIRLERSERCNILNMFGSWHIIVIVVLPVVDVDVVVVSVLVGVLVGMVIVTIAISAKGRLSILRRRKGAVGAGDTSDAVVQRMVRVVEFVIDVDELIGVFNILWAWVLIIVIVIIIRVVSSKDSIFISQSKVPLLFVLVSMLQPILLTRTVRKRWTEDVYRLGPCKRGRTEAMYPVKVSVGESSVARPVGQAGVTVVGASVDKGGADRGGGEGRRGKVRGGSVVFKGCNEVHILSISSGSQARNICLKSGDRQLMRYCRQVVV